MCELSAARIQKLLGPHPWRDQIQVFDLVDSTNNLAKALAQQGAPEGTVLIADRQSAGRGRMGRSFLSPGGMGIYLSLILRPACPPQQLMHLTCATGSAMCGAVEHACGIRPGIKWTNDLVVGSKKLGGILTELSLDPKTALVDYAVVGIGINCCQREQDFDEAIRSMACSAEMAAGHPIDRNALAAEMIRALFQMNDILLTRKDALLDAYRTDCITLGKQISVVGGGQTRHGTALNIDADGALVVAFDDGTTGCVNSGEVSIRGLYGYV